MKSWSNWYKLEKGKIDRIPMNVKGVYAIRLAPKRGAEVSEIIYIGQAGRGKQTLRTRIRNLVKGVNETDTKKAKTNFHHKAPQIKKHKNEGLEFSWIECKENPDGVENCLLLAFHVSNGRLPRYNEGF